MSKLVEPIHNAVLRGVKKSVFRGAIAQGQRRYDLVERKLASGTFGGPHVLMPHHCRSVESILLGPGGQVARAAT